jgi:hypothetical protein
LNGESDQGEESERGDENGDKLHDFKTKLGEAIDEADNIRNQRATSQPQEEFRFWNDGDDPPVYLFEQELFHRGDEYIPGSSQNGHPKGVTLVYSKFSEMVDELVKHSVYIKN